jgi:hypothetical protein
MNFRQMVQHLIAQQAETLNIFAATAMLLKEERR